MPKTEVSPKFKFPLTTLRLDDHGRPHEVAIVDDAGERPRSVRFRYDGGLMDYFEVELTERGIEVRSGLRPMTIMPRMSNVVEVEVKS